MIDLSIWDGRFDLAEWEHNPCGPWLILLDGPQGSVTATYDGTVEQVVRRFLEMRRDEGPGSMAVVVDSKCKLVYGHVWDECDPFAKMAGCAVMYAAIARFRPDDGVEGQVETAFSEMMARGAFDDLLGGS
jgi:hypothetical protein